MIKKQEKVSGSYVKYFFYENMWLKINFWKMVDKYGLSCPINIKIHFSLLDN